MRTLDAFRSLYDPVPGYLDAATCGIPTRATAAAVRDVVDRWQAGTQDLAGFDEAVARSRAAYARLVHVDRSRVAVGAQVSPLVGMVAASLPDGAEVLTAEGDFSSLTYPFVALADRLTVRAVPLDRLADEVRPSTALVAYSLVQSRDGAIADADAVRAATTDVGARTLVDLTQAAGWLPVDAGAFDLTVCGAYKWLGAPRGTAFLTLPADGPGSLRPTCAGWYAADDVWASVYGHDLRLAPDARRFDISPAWMCWAGTAPALEAFDGVDVGAVRGWSAGLADRFRAGLGLAPTGSAIVSLPDDADGSLRTRLACAGCRTAGRGGGVRLAFHVWNDEHDVDRALEACLTGPAGRAGAGARSR